MSTSTATTSTSKTTARRPAVSTTVRRTVDSAPAPVETSVSSTPVVQPVVAPVVPVVAPVQPVVAPVVPVAATASESVPAEEQPKKKTRQRPRIRSWDDLHKEISENLKLAYTSLQSVHRMFGSLVAAHNREVHHTKTRESAHRTPTIVFDEQLVNYFRRRLSPEELVVLRKEGDTRTEVSLADLSGETRLHRTDVTQLYNRVFKKHNMQDAEDGRNILYSGDADLVALLTSGGYKAELETSAQQIRDGTYKLTIFNIQCFTNQHLRKVTKAE